MIVTEKMNAALANPIIGLCWSAGPASSPGGAETLCDSSDPAASESARNPTALISYVTICRFKGVTHAELAAALRGKFDGDGAAYDAILALPNA